MQKKKTKRRRAVAASENPSLLPPPSLYTRHALALARVLQYLEECWQGYFMLMPEPGRDDQINRKVLSAIAQANSAMYDAVRRCAEDVIGYTDAVYVDRLRDNSRFDEHVPLNLLIDVMPIVEQTLMRNAAGRAELRAEREVKS